MNSAALQQENERLRAQVAQEQEYHGKTVRVIGEVLGVEPSLYTKPEQYLAACAQVRHAAYRLGFIDGMKHAAKIVASLPWGDPQDNIKDAIRKEAQK